MGSPAAFAALIDTLRSLRTKGSLISARALLDLHFLRNPQKLVKMAEELRERFYGGNEQSKEAFEELFAMVSALEAEREEARENARARAELLYDRCHKMRVKNQTLKAKSLALLDLYNALAEEVKDRSDSSSGSSSDEEEELQPHVNTKNRAVTKKISL